MRSATTLVILGMLWAVTVNAAAAKRDSEDLFFRHLRSPFDRKLKGTRRGCSAYGHSCFGGYGKRGGAPTLLNLAPPLPLPLPLPQQQQHREGVGEGEGDAEEKGRPEVDQVDQVEQLDPARIPLRSLRSLDPDDASSFLVLRQSPVSSRTPLWGRPSSGVVASRAPSSLGGDLMDSGTALQALQLQTLQGAEGAEGGEDSDPFLGTMASRQFLRRWLRAYRRPPGRVPL